jgi:hypothetical protein
MSILLVSFITGKWERNGKAKFLALSSAPTHHRPYIFYGFHRVILSTLDLYIFHAFLPASHYFNKLYFSDGNGIIRLYVISARAGAGSGEWTLSTIN